ncbi:MAG: hypothetical protein GY697_22540 [Desulfobacterales bacterium]|nr:hypothetical protein [Desulfobacterales bacterium]
MRYHPKNRLSATDTFASDHFSEDGKMKTVEKTYRCKYFIQALTLKDTLQSITGETYDIEQNGNEGWQVFAE